MLHKQFEACLLLCWWGKGLQNVCKCQKCNDDDDNDDDDDDEDA